MSKQKGNNQLDRQVKCSNTSHDFVYYLPARKTQKITKISPTQIGKRPIYKFFIDYDNKYYPPPCMLDLSSTSVVISPEAAKAFKIPVVRRTRKVQSNDSTG